MYIVTITSLIAVLLVLIESKRKISFGFGLAFFCVTFIQAIHYDYGNDYMVYMRGFYEFTYKPFSFHYLYDYFAYRDPFWPILCYVFKPVGFFGMVACLTIFQNLVYFYFIKKYVTEEWLALGVFVYLFTPDIYLLNMSMLRQGFAEAVFLFSFIIVQKKSSLRFAVAIILMVFVGQIHASANLFIPFLLWSFIPMKKGLWVAIVFMVLYVIAFIYRSFAANAMSFFLQMRQFERFDIYQNLVEGGVGFGYAIMSIPAIIILLFMKDNSDERLNRIVSMAVFERMVVFLSTVYTIAGRLSTYFAVFYMVAIPVAYGKIRSYGYKAVFATIYVLMTLYCYWGFFKNITYAKYYEQFHTIFEVIFQ